MSSWKPRFTENHVMILKRARTDHRFFRLEAMEVVIRQFDSTWSRPLKRQVIHKKPAVALLPYDPHLDAVVLIEQFRVGALGDAVSPWMLEVVAGVVDQPQDDIQTTAERETWEETGLRVSKLEHLHTYWVSPGMFTERVHLFCGCVDASQAAGIHGLATEDEDILVHVFPFAQAQTMLAQGQYNNAPTIMALQWLQLHRPTLRQRWLQNPA